MEIRRIETVLGTNTYPGRGILLGRSSDGASAVIAYFIMGRSENSRNRVFLEDGEGIRTQAFDPTKLTDPSLIIYSPVRVLEHTTVVTNGDQTDTVYDYLKQGKTFADALRTRTFEPDGPNFTPRISGVVELNGNYRLSILKSADGNANSVRRYFYEYESPVNGEGHLIHTYSGDGDPLPSFDGEPTRVGIYGEIESFSEAVWRSLNPENKVSLFTRFINLKTGLAETRIINKNQ
jgi:Archaeal IMP cyclohydrolase